MATKRPTSQPRASSTSEFWLVVAMLIALFLLIIALLAFTYFLRSDSAVLDFSKVALSILVGAFGAWIGAGAAYFFGKENLAESSASTEEALRIALGVSKPKRIRDLTLTVMNKDFMFNFDSKKDEVLKKLNASQYIDYWWVPVCDQGGKGILEDIIHARVFWDTRFQGSQTISEIISGIEAIPELKTLHGASFFVKVSLDDEIADVSDNMRKSGTAVGVIVDENGKPTYCFTRQNILNVQH